MSNKIAVDIKGHGVVEVEAGITVIDALKSVLSGKKAKRVILARVDGRLSDLATTIKANSSVEPVFPNEDGALDVLRHTAAHVMAQAVKELFPGVRIAIGPAVQNGFYYDFDYERGFTPEDLENIEKRMAGIVKAAEPVVRSEMPLSEAREKFQKEGEKYKVELLDELEKSGEDTVSIYSQGSFEDLCRGPHLPHTGHVKAFRLLNVAGAYWRGDSEREQLQRIYGTAFFDKKELKKYLFMLEEAKKRDHRKLGRELDLFSIQDEIGPGLILWHPRGAAVRQAIETFWQQEHLKRGYERLYTPHIARQHLWQTSGHLDFYSDSMYSSLDIDKVSYQLKPMNCPFHISVYNSRKRSYRELPLRWCELGTVYRYEMTGTLHGLMRVRGFTQDDAHIFCRPDQLDDEIREILDMTLYMLRVFGFDRYDIYLSTRPDKYVGSDENWELATSALRNALDSQGLSYELDPGEGVFYGPKIDIKIKDSLDRSWQCSTVQVDFNLPERFGMGFTGPDGSEHAPIMVHRALLGSLERFFGVLIEHYAGAFPVWLAPVQAMVVTVADRHNEWAVEVANLLRHRGVRAEADTRSEKLNRKIRDAQVLKIPFMLVVGDREVEERSVSPRTRKGETFDAVSADQFVEMLNGKVKQEKGEV
jgi:threonyl-tRNA synthetase